MERRNSWGLAFGLAGCIVAPLVDAEPRARSVALVGCRAISAFLAGPLEVRVKLIQYSFFSILSTSRLFRIPRPCCMRIDAGTRVSLRCRVQALLLHCTLQVKRGARENIVPISCHVQLSRVRKRNQSSNGDLSALRRRPDDVCRRVAACGEAIAAKNSAA